MSIAHAPRRCTVCYADARAYKATSQASVLPGQVSKVVCSTPRCHSMQFIGATQTTVAEDRVASAGPARLADGLLAATAAHADAVHDVALLRLVPEAARLVRPRGAGQADQARQLTVLPATHAEQEAEHVALCVRKHGLAAAEVRGVQWKGGRGARAGGAPPQPPHDACKAAQPHAPDGRVKQQSQHIDGGCCARGPLHSYSPCLAAMPS